MMSLGVQNKQRAALVSSTCFVHALSLLFFLYLSIGGLWEGFGKKFWWSWKV